jgi:DNA-binding transcriptional ArsR family regulator
MENEQGITFVNIPMEVFASRELTPGEKMLYGWLSIFKKQCCFQSNEALAEATGLSERTISSALKKLEEMGYIYVEMVGGNSARRRIYALFDNPKKLAYLAKKGAFGRASSSFPQENSATFPQADATGVEGGRKNCEGSKNCEGGSKNCDPQNGGEGRKNCDHKIIKDNIKDSARESAPGLAEQGAAGRLPRSRADYDSDESYERDFYERNTMHVCVAE